jgi:SAM-dependent methyltransferase
MSHEQSMTRSEPEYLRPYLRAVSRHGGGFGSLLWASPRTQEARFDAMLRVYDMNGRKVLDAGCGRADLLPYLIARGIFPRAYLGLEAIAELVPIARQTIEGNSQAAIVEGDFVGQPECLDAGADVAVFCGSLNTLDAFAFEMVLRRAFAVAHCGVVFNFLSSPDRACAAHLTWHRPQRVMRFVRSMSRLVRVLDDYLDGDCTVGIFKDGL